MSLLIRAAALLLCASLWVSTQTVAGAGLPALSVVEADLEVRLAGVGAGFLAGPAAQAATPAPEGKEILTRKCFQCHQASMWSSLRQDRKGWESVLYRMVGRGALWTEAEITAMADFLAQTRGPAK
jgi:cytochrome c5